MNIICFYPFKKLEKQYLAAVSEYKKRLGRYCKIKFQPYPKGTPPDSPNIVYITSGQPHATMLSSEGFADYLAQKSIHGQSDILFLLTEESPDLANTLSLSHAKLSLPMLTVLLSEQIYRAFRIIHNHSYHK